MDILAGCPQDNASKIASNVEHLFDFLLELSLLERAALNLVQADGVHKILGAEHPQELSHVELRHEHLFIALDYIAEIRRQRVQMPQMHVADLTTLSTLGLDRGGDGPMRRAPGHDEQISLRVAHRLDI